VVVRSDIKPQLAVGNDEEREAIATVAARSKRKRRKRKSKSERAIESSK
jgi:hypothetical protein